MFGNEHFEGCFPHLIVPGSVFTVAPNCHCELLYWGSSCPIRNSLLTPVSPRISLSTTKKKGLFQGPIRSLIWWRGGDLNSRPSGYEHEEIWSDPLVSEGLKNRCPSKMSLRYLPPPHSGPGISSLALSYSEALAVEHRY